MDPRSFLDRFERRPGPPAELTAALADLAKLSRDRPDLAAPSKSLARILEIAFRSPDTSEIGTIDDDRLIRNWSDGIPIFRVLSPQLDKSALLRRVAGLSEAIGGEGDSSFRKAIRKGQLDLPSMVSEVLSGRPEEVTRQAFAIGVDDQFAASLLRMALLPALARVSVVLDQARPEGIWDRGDCPHCGSRPLLAESRGIEQRLVYRCGLCAAGWSGQRLRCPSCGESDPKSLGYSFVEGEQERHRLGRCETCSSHWKIVSTLTPLSAPGLLVADLATFHLDVLASES
ncbi:formate dehydrogenase accessory protein FdhE [Tundrisphaera lichenicola]|uniref:formate dehydrogenase accessory protein FdhE n=1 Tax=Tundrisphaera lichenicola TaxID=2029860 RepID=UPI003EC11A8F